MDINTLFNGITITLTVALLFVGLPFFAIRELVLKRPPLISTGAVGTAFVRTFDVAVVLLLFVFFTSAISPPDPEAAMVINSELIIASLVSQALTIAIALGLIAWRVKLKDQFGLTLSKGLKHLWWIPLTIVVVWASLALQEVSGFTEYLNSLLGRDNTQETVTFIRDTDNIPLLVMMVIMATIGAPVSEELLFRGYLYPVLKRFNGRIFSTIFTGLLFSVIHNNLGAMIPLFIMGMLLSYIYEKSGSLLVPILAHAVFNSITVFFQLILRFNPELIPAT